MDKSEWDNITNQKMCGTSSERPGLALPQVTIIHLQ